MLSDSSQDLRTYFLLKFTRNLVRNANPTIFLKVEDDKRRTQKDLDSEKLKAKVMAKIPSLNGTSKPREYSVSKPRPVRIVQPQVKPSLKVPETNLPPQFDYLRPTATNKQVDLNIEKLNPVLNDPAVDIIEVNGANENLIVKGRMGVKPTGITLTKEEVDSVIQIFSEKSKIPVGEGVTQIALGRFILSAIISEESGSKFVIKKIVQEQLRR